MWKYHICGIFMKGQRASGICLLAQESVSSYTTRYYKTSILCFGIYITREVLLGYLRVNFQKSNLFKKDLQPILKKFGWTHILLWSHWYPCFGHLVTLGWFTSINNLNPCRRCKTFLPKRQLVVFEIFDWCLSKGWSRNFEHFSSQKECFLVWWVDYRLSM